MSLTLNMDLVPTDRDCALSDCPFAVDTNEHGDADFVFCVECYMPQIDTPNGRTCARGHGGADGWHESELHPSVTSTPVWADVRRAAYEHNARLRTTKEKKMNEQSNATNEMPANESSTPAHQSRHKVRALSHTFGAAKTKTQQIGVMCEITEGPCKGYVATWYGSFTTDAHEYTMRGMEALGFKGDAPACASMYTGSEGLATFEHDRDLEGNARIRIAWINGMDVVMAERYEGAALASFAQRVNATYRTKHGGNAAQSQQLPPVQTQQQPQQYQQRQQPAQQSMPSGGYGGRGGNNGMPPQGDTPPPNDPPPWDQRR